MNYKKLQLADLKKGFSISFGPIVFSEEEIMAFAKEFDPLPFHTDKKAAEKGIFGRLVASGPQLFIVTHKRFCLPYLGHTLLAGLGITDWEFLKPVYPDYPVVLTLSIEEMSINEHKNKAKITWQYQFRDENNELVQSLKVIALHKIV